ncbi:MAG: threonine ammonia-lyase, biosynthetic [Deltaproteobacteria bacterium]|nr:MAG: threonine ammonia-lyase, biosynthetic [Deltaproteobacteria bacterium]
MARARDYLERILTSRVYDVAVETPLERAPALSSRIGNDVLLKREDMQPVFSFKLRGAYNKMATLPDAALKRGVIAASAGNHAQGVALAAQRLGCRAAIVMPVTTPRIKIDAVAARGAEVVLVGDSYDEAYRHAKALERRRKLTFVHPYDDPDVIGLFADGVAVKRVGKETFRLARRYVDEMIRVDTDAICAAIKDAFEDTRSILEPAGALPVAGAKAYAERTGIEDETLIAVACGANMNFNRLRFVAERAEVGERREAILAVTIPERPGSFRRFCAILGPRNITEFNYRMADADRAHVFVGVGINSRAETAAIVRTLQRHGLSTLDLSDDEMAKLHVRHLVGGHAALARDELVYRFEFPERPGALLQFLSRMRTDWNISLFHYRNHGADYGRVLVGMEVPAAEMPEFKRFLGTLGYPCIDESGNPAYRLFLG